MFKILKTKTIYLIFEDCELIEDLITNYGNCPNKSEYIFKKYNSEDIEVKVKIAKPKEIKDLENSTVYGVLTRKPNESWECTWNNFSGEPMPTNIREKIKKQIQYEKDKIRQEKLKKEEQERLKIEEREKRFEEMKEAASRSKHIIRAVNFLREYENDHIEVIVDYGYTYSSEDGEKPYVKSISVVLKKSDTLVFEEIGDYGEYVSVYRPGKWEEYLVNIYNREFALFQKRRKMEEEKKRIREEEEKQKTLKFERERYLPIDE